MGSGTLGIGPSVRTAPTKLFRKSFFRAVRTQSLVQKITMYKVLCPIFNCNKLDGLESPIAVRAGRERAAAAAACCCAGLRAACCWRGALARGCCEHKLLQIVCNSSAGVLAVA